MPRTKKRKIDERHQDLESRLEGRNELIHYLLGLLAKIDYDDVGDDIRKMGFCPKCFECLAENECTCHKPPEKEKRTRLPKANELVGGLNEWDFVDWKQGGARNQIIQCIFNVKKGQTGSEFTVKSEDGKETKCSGVTYQFSKTDDKDTIKELVKELTAAGYKVGLVETKPLTLVISNITVG